MQNNGQNYVFVRPNSDTTTENMLKNLGCLHKLLFRKKKWIFGLYV